MTGKLTKPNWSEARRQVDAIAGQIDAEAMFQVFDDEGKDGRLAEFRYGRLSDQTIQKWLIVKIKAGCGVFVVVNRTDGKGRRRHNMTHYMAAFVDLDGKPLPTEWRIAPDIVVESSKGRWHCYWLLEPGTDLAAWTGCQARLAACYGGDAKVIDAPRVMRIAGFDHQKAAPFRSRLVECPDPKDVRLGEFNRHTLQELADAHPADDKAPRAPAEKANAAVDVEWDTTDALQRASAYLTSLETPESGNRNNTAYGIACKLNDMAISAEKSLEFLTKWNDGLDDPLPEHELAHVIKSASRYKQNPPGADSAGEDEFDFERDDSQEMEAESGEFEKQPIMKLNNVNEHNVGKYFRLVNLNGKMRVVWWARSPLDLNVRVPQFWRKFKVALANKYYTRLVKTTDAHGEEKTSAIRISVAESWLKSTKRYTYDGVVLCAEMDSDSPDAINLWRGYGVEENTTGDWSLLREHIRQVIANGKKDRDDYIIKWIAWALQNADKPCEVALILKSATHGTGKGMLLRAVRKLFGAHAMQISKGGLLTGRFNAHLAMTCFLFVDEMTLADNKESATLNSTLTEDVIPIEPKGVDAYMMPNHVKIAAASNQEHVALISGTDRRFIVFEVSDKHARDIAYFKAINDQLENGGYSRMLHDLLEMDLDDWHPRNTAGCIDDKAPEKLESAPAEVQWLAGYLNSGTLDCQVDGRGGSHVFAGDFYERARRSTRALAGWSDNRFAAYLKTWGCMRIRSGTSHWEFRRWTRCGRRCGPSIRGGLLSTARSTNGTTPPPRNPISVDPRPAARGRTQNFIEPQLFGQRAHPSSLFDFAPAKRHLFSIRRLPKLHKLPKPMAHKHNPAGSLNS